MRLEAAIIRIRGEFLIKPSRREGFKHGDALLHVVRTWALYILLVGLVDNMNYKFSFGIKALSENTCQIVEDLADQLHMEMIIIDVVGMSRFSAFPKFVCLFNRVSVFRVSVGT